MLLLRVTTRGGNDRNRVDPATEERRRSKPASLRDPPLQVLDPPLPHTNSSNNHNNYRNSNQNRGQGEEPLRDEDADVDERQSRQERLDTTDNSGTDTATVVPTAAAR